MSSKPVVTFHERVPNPDEWAEYGIEWNDGGFNGPFATLTDAADYMNDDSMADFRPARLIRRTVETFPWESA